MAGFGVVRGFSPQKIELAPARKQSACSSLLFTSQPAESRTTEAGIRIRATAIVRTNSSGSASATGEVGGNWGDVRCGLPCERLSKLRFSQRLGGDHNMATTILGIVREGKIVPEIPLPEGLEVQIMLPEAALVVPPELQAELDAWSLGSA